MYCKNCGNQLDDKAVICPKCGMSVGKPQSADDGSFLWAVVGFLVPIVAVILYFVWKDEKPRCAKQAAQGGLVQLGFGASLLIATIIMNVVGIIGSIAGVF